MNNLQYNWSAKWIQPYETPWGILEKFRYANTISENDILELLGNKEVKQLKLINNAGNIHRSLIFLSSIDSELTKQILGINLIEYNNRILEKVNPLLPQINFVSYLRSNVSYCPLCLS